MVLATDAVRDEFRFKDDWVCAKYVFSSASTICLRYRGCSSRPTWSVCWFRQQPGPSEVLSEHPMA